MAKIVDVRGGDDLTGLVTALEDGHLILLRDQPFDIRPDETSLIDPAIYSGEAKNVSYDPETGRLGGVNLDGPRLETCRSMLARYADFARDLLFRVAPGYEATIQRRRTSFRPGDVAERALSPRKDDRRLHVDAFPANPNQGRRILRVFTNVHPGGRPRHWRVGDHAFETFASAFQPRLQPGPSPLTAAAMQALKLTKGRRTAYDPAMLQLHDLAKLDDGFQATTPQSDLMLPAGASWLVYTDSVLHAAMAGQHAFEQTFLLPPSGMQDPAKAPVAVLERLLGRRLA